MKSIQLTLAAALVAASATMYSQNTTAAATASTATPATKTVTGASIKERKDNQQDRIAQGLKAGDLSAADAAKLETQEAGINKEEHGMREQDNGKLTTQDKTLLNSQLNTESKDIHADKQDGFKESTKGEVNKRIDNQEDRIAEGVKKDDLTDTQVAKLEGQEHGIRTEEAGMRAQDDGKLSAADKKALNNQLNQESRRIARDERRTAHKK